MSAADRKVTTRVFDQTIEKMVEVLKATPFEDDDIPWTYEVEEHGINFFHNDVLVERWVTK